MADAVEPPPRSRWEGIDLTPHFACVEGTFVLLDNATGETLVHDSERASTPYLPASTFKIPHTLIALESGMVDGFQFEIRRMRNMRKHPGTIDRHGASWRIRLCVGGKRYSFTLDGDLNRDAVEQEAREKHAELHRRNGKGLPGPMSFSELLRRYRKSELPQLSPNSRRTYGSSLDAFKTYFVKEEGDPPAHEIRPGHIHGFMTWRRHHSPDGSRLESLLAARSIAKDRAILHIVFAFGETLEVVDANPVRKIKPPKGDQREPLILSADQHEKLLEACEGQPMLSLYVLTLGETGVRCDSEALWLRWEDVDLERRFLTVESVRKGRRTKSGKRRNVPMTPRLRRAMAEHMAHYRMKTYAGNRTEWIFHHEFRRGHAKPGDRITGLRRAFAGAVKRAGLPEDLRQHDLRHRRVTTWLAEGQPIALVSKAMGHSSVKVTRGYLYLMDRDLLPLGEEPAEDELRALVSR